LIWERYGSDGLEYAFKWAGSIFSLGDGTLRLGPGECGFTCASLVLAIFRSAGVLLVEMDGWPARADDEAWQVKMKRYLPKADPDPVTYRQRLDAQTESLRFRSAEVVGACSFEELPVDFKNAETAAGEINEAIAVNQTLLPRS
jgi:hypothetical protein